MALSSPTWFRWQFYGSRKFQAADDLNGAESRTSTTGHRVNQGLMLAPLRRLSFKVDWAFRLAWAGLRPGFCLGASRDAPAKNVQQVTDSITRALT